MPAIIGREKVSPVIKSALCKHIMHEREKRKQEAAEAEKDFERKAKEEEEKRKKLEEQHSTLEDIKEQLTKLKEKQERLRQEKHQLFWQFRKVLNEEAKQKRLRELNDPQSAPVGHYPHHSMPINPHHMLPPGYKYQGQSSAYLSQTQSPMQQGLKRPHSPTPPSSGSLPPHLRPVSAMQSPHHARMQGGYQPMHASNTDRPNPQHSYSAASAGKLTDSGIHHEERSKPPRISMIPPNPNPFASIPGRSNSPGRYTVKSERDHASYSPNSSNLPVHKYQSSPGPRNLHTKHS